MSALIFESREQLAETMGRDRDLANAVFRGLDLSGMRLTALNLEGADFSDANLAGVVLAGANLEGGKLNNVSLQNALIAGVNLEGADLSNADLSGSRFFGVNVSGVDFTGAKTEGTYGLGVSWSSAKVPPAVLPEMVPIAWLLAPLFLLFGLVTVLILFGRKKRRSAKK